ncbi:protein Star-like [Cloeon dipterum]|uniref:protein Star-like n=1 Tax=Cloeon dipterum TaxID=197152 RepID=UPI00321F64D2
MEHRKRVFFAILVALLVIFGLYQFNMLTPAGNFISNDLPAAVSFKTTVKSKARTLTDLQGLLEDDPVLLDYTRGLLIEPAERDTPYAISQPNLQDYSGMNMSLIIYSLLKHKKNGFFVDCGAFDGEDASVSLTLEKDFNWNGLMVDAGPKQIQRLLLKGRKSWVAPTCMSTSNKSMMVSFMESEMQSAIVSKDTQVGNNAVVQTLCIPFHTFMKVLGIKKVDLFNLDVEGAELEILKTIDFNRVKIDAMMIEHFNNKEPVQKEILSIMEKNGFKLYEKNAYDFVFIHNSV